MSDNIKNEELIKSISYDQNEIIYNILKLYNNGNTVDCDPTFSIGKFYEQSEEFFIPKPKYKFDVEPVLPDVQKIEPLGEFPLEDNSIGSILIDPPFIIGCGPSTSKPQDKDNKNNVMNRRFSAYCSIQDLFESYYYQLYEAYRVLKPEGICIFKCQTTITCSTFYNVPGYVWMIAEQLGFHTMDIFTLLAKNRLIGHWKKQQHARSYSSNFIVFKKSDLKKFKPVNYFKWSENYG
jgi:hypothetical protein